MLKLDGITIFDEIASNVANITSNFNQLLAADISAITHILNLLLPEAAKDPKVDIMIM